MISFQDVLMRMLAAAVLGGVIGVNRGRLEWAAGLRTHMLVSVGAALAIIVSAYGFRHALTFDHVVLDPSRIAAQVVSGIGFLGAGTILFSQRDQVVRGLTTAAGLWAVATVGLAAGAGLFMPAIVATAILWIILAVLKPIERRFVKPLRQHASLQVELTGVASLAMVERALSELHAPIRRMLLRRGEDGQDVVDIRFVTILRPEKLTELAEACRVVNGVSAVSVVLSARGGK